MLTNGIHRHEDILRHGISVLLKNHGAGCYEGIIQWYCIINALMLNTNSSYIEQFVVLKQSILFRRYCTYMNVKTALGWKYNSKAKIPNNTINNECF